MKAYIVSLCIVASLCLCVSVTLGIAPNKGETINTRNEFIGYENCREEVNALSFTKNVWLIRSGSAVNKPNSVCKVVQEPDGQYIIISEFSYNAISPIVFDKEGYTEFANLQITVQSTYKGIGSVEHSSNWNTEILEVRLLSTENNLNMSDETIKYVNKIVTNSEI